MAKKAKKSRKLSLYSNLPKAKSKPKINLFKFNLKLSKPKFKFDKKKKKDDKYEKEKQYIESLPKFSLKRIAYHFSPKHIFHYWFSKRGVFMVLKITGIFFLIICIFIGGLFAYFRKDLDSIRPSELAKNVQSSINTYLDRNGNVLWEDKGSGNYKLVVESKAINTYMKQATVAIEDKDFYKHSGVSISGLIRAAINNFFGGSTQGGSTLTQQLIKQVFFYDEASERGINGIPRKIKEMILAIEVERMYNKDQILTLYLNESPYGGRRNGVESGAQTYFGKSSKDLTLAEAALLAAIPQNPAVYDPYNVYGHERLIRRQHSVLDAMVSMKYITKAQSDEAKKYPIIDHINPESDQYEGIKAAHFVQMVKAQLEDELGVATLGKGGLTIKTTLDIRIQDKLQEGMNEMFASYIPEYAGFSNGASTVEDAKTGQIVALVGSRDFYYPGFGQDNASTAFIQPGSSIKPLVYSELFEKKAAGKLNFGSGSILKDENIDSLYGAKVYNADRNFLGDITIRKSLATSRNIPAIKAMYISGVKETLNTIHAMGVTSYCTNGDEVNAGLSAAIGGCGLKQIDLVNGYASIAREGVYKPQSIVLEVKDSSKKVLKKWVDVAGKQIVDKQATYIVSDILTDDNARVPLAGYHAIGQYIEGVQTATKTGTSDKGGYAKDIWMVSYSPALVMAVWLGNSDASLLSVGTSAIPGPIIDKVMSYAHLQIYAPEGKWKSGDWFARPDGIQESGGELYPSWWEKSVAKTVSQMDFDILSKYKATNFTPALARISLEVTKTIDPITNKEVYIAPEGYDATKDDNVHLASDVKPEINNVIVSTSVTEKTADATKYSIQINPTIQKGTYPLSNTSIQVLIDGTVYQLCSDACTIEYTIYKTDASKNLTVSATVSDSALYSYTFVSQPGDQSTATLTYIAP